MDEPSRSLTGSGKALEQRIVHWDVLLLQIANVSSGMFTKTQKKDPPEREDL